MAIGALLEIEPLPNAVSCVNDLSAIGALHKRIEAGMTVPERIALAGFTDIEAASFVAVPLTTMKEPTFEIGRTAAQIVIDEIEGKRKDPLQVKLKPSRIARRETAYRELKCHTLTQSCD